MAKTADIVASGAAAEVKQFAYKARNGEGKIVAGTAKALRREDVVNELLAKQMTPLKITGGGAGGAGLATDISFRKSAKKRDLVIASRQLASMLDSGLGYIEAIEIVQDGMEDPMLSSGFNEVKIAIKNGQPFSEALRQQGDLFPPMMINLVTSGEAGGKIKDAMNRVADQLDAEDKLRAKVKKALMYPLTVFVISMIIFAFMMLFLVPQFTDTFTDLGGPGTQLPALTRGVVAVSEIMKWAVPLMLVLVVPFAIWYRRNKNAEWLREFVDPKKLKLPVFGTLFHKIALARFTRNLSGLLEAGVERLEALEITAKTVGNIQMERAVLAARDAQRAGLPLIEPLKAEPLFPSMVIQMVEVGERSGRTSYMLGKAADIYDRDVDQITDNMSALIEPIFLVGLGIMVGTLVIAIYLPYLGLSDVIDNT